MESLIHKAHFYLKKGEHNGMESGDIFIQVDKRGSRELNL